jgi:prolyl-tRNA synthetase
MEEAPGQSKSALKKAEKQAKMAAAKAEKAATVPIRGAGASKKTDESKQIIGMTVAKEANFSQWYHELVIKAELVEYYSEVRGKLGYCFHMPSLLTRDVEQISGFYILRREPFFLLGV